MFTKQTIKDVKVKGKVVLVRADYNVPLQDGVVTNDLRIRASLPTLEYLLDHGARKVIVISHLGRPEGRDKTLSLEPVAQKLKELLPERKVSFIDDVSGPDVEEAVEALPNQGILLLENLRFYRGEEQNSDDFAREIAETTHAELFVQDGFAVVHRAHASTAAITKELPSVAGLLLEKEITTLTQVLSKPKRPFYSIIGGSKVEDKQPLIESLLKVADQIWVGGKIAADGYRPEVEGDKTTERIHVATEFCTDSEGHKYDVAEGFANELAEQITNSAQTVLWNGTLGKTEDGEFAKSSVRVAEAIGTKPGLTSVICGGDTTGFVENLQVTHPELKFTLISTGGGAALEFITGQPLPGYDNLDDAE